MCRETEPRVVEARVAEEVLRDVRPSLDPSVAATEEGQIMSAGVDQTPTRRAAEIAPALGARGHQEVPGIPIERERCVLGREK